MSQIHGAHKVIPSLDGLRAVAVITVLFGHAGVSRLIPGGFGVTVFFFLSGFLITTLFVRESEQYGRIALRAFYLRRLLRLSPPLFTTLILVYLLVAAGLHPGVLDPTAMASQALYFYNYYAAWAPEVTEGAKGFNVLWSLAVEEHFYMVFPLVYVAYMRGKVRISHIMLMLGAFLVWRMVNIHLLAVPANDVYMRSDTRFDSILWGCLLAMWHQTGTAARLFPDAPLPRAAIIIGALAVILLCFLWRGADFRETWRYSLQGAALLPLFHYAVKRPDLLIFRPLNWKPLMVVGAWSYSIYLIHYVLLIGLEFHGLLPASPVIAAVLVLAIASAYAALVSSLVEEPVRGLRRRLTGHSTVSVLPDRLARP